MRTLLSFGWALVIGPLVASTGTPEDWPVSPPSVEGLNANALARLDAHVQKELPHLRSLLVARHGRVVFEKYYADASREGLHNMQSVTKSVASALVGIALRKGLITSLDNRVLGYFPEYRDGISDRRMRDVTIRHLLTMASGIDETQLSFDKSVANPIAEILSEKLLYAPGQGFKYSSAAAHLLGGVLRKVAGKTVLEFAETELFRPLGMGRVDWYADKTGLQSGGMSGLLRSRDLLKLGELYLRRGRWKDVEIVPPAYVAESVKPQDRGEFSGEAVVYGYGWWITSVGGRDAFYARGYGGQYLMVIPSADLVVLCTSDWKQPEYQEHFLLVNRFVLPSIANE